MHRDANASIVDTHAGRRAPAPPGIQLLRVAFAMLGRLFPGPATSLAYRLWFTTRRFPLTAHERDTLARGKRFEIEVSGRPVIVYAWGQGPAVLMVHGWHGAASNFVEFVEPLAAAGFRVVAFDAPAHGASPGKRTTLPEIVKAMEVLADNIGPLHAIIGHSFGVLCLTFALAMKRISPDRVVCISSPARLEGLFASFSDTLGLPRVVRKRFCARLEHDFGADIWARLSPENQAASFDVPALMIHDADDRSVPIEESEALSRVWRNSRLVRTEKLGHRRILADANVIRRVVNFLSTPI